MKPSFVIFAFLAVAAFTSAVQAQSAGGPPLPAVTFLERAPLIDGVLDEELGWLPPREFAGVEKSGEDNPVAPASYRLAYGTDFFYLYVEVDDPDGELNIRDRAYQNGDGFHMVIAAPRAGGERSGEFYVLAASPSAGSGIGGSQVFFWYYNVGTIFKFTGPNTLVRTAEGEGRISFELYLPWTDVHPHHPWLSEGGVGFNLRFVHALGDTECNRYVVLSDDLIDAEGSERLYARLEFAAPKVEGAAQTFVQALRGHIAEGEMIEARAVTAAGAEGEERLAVTLMTPEGGPIAREQTSYGYGEGLTIHRFALPQTAALMPGAYKYSWRGAGGAGEWWLSVLPPLEGGELGRRIEAAAANLCESSRATLLFLARELEEQLGALYPAETAGPQRLAAGRLLRTIEAAERGEDLLAAERGDLRRAFRSGLDGTLQPYVVRLPKDYQPGAEYPLLVFLHGSGSDERTLLRVPSLTQGRFIELGPNARGPSHAYVHDHAQEDIFEAIEAVRRQYSVDGRNIFLMGFSMGGYGVYRTFYEHPELYKGLIVLSGHPDIGNEYYPGEDHPNFLEPRFQAVFKGVPMFIFHGGKDRNCPFELTAEAVEGFKAAGAEVEFHAEADKGHELPSSPTLLALAQWLAREAARER